MASIPREAPIYRAPAQPIQEPVKRYRVIVSEEYTLTEVYPPAARMRRGIPGVYERQCSACAILTHGPRAGWIPTRTDERGRHIPLLIDGAEMAHGLCPACAQHIPAPHRSAPAQRIYVTR